MASLIRVLHFRILSMIVAGVLGLAVFSSPINAQAVAAYPDETATETEEKADPVDPYAVPEGASPQELLNHIRSVKRLRGRTVQSANKAAKAVVATAEAVRAHAESDLDQLTDAIGEQIAALGFMAQRDRASKKQLETLIEELSKDDRGAIRELAKVEALKLRIESAGAADKEEQLALVNEIKSMVSEKSFDRDVFGLTYTLARSISMSENTDVAADLYDQMADWMIESDDATMQQRAPKMTGAARRMRLPGTVMQIEGKTTTGETFDWDAYRGKVVLVDFWASWCGPCRGEVPNMKRNLELYSDRGFAVVGVNLDRTLEACEEYVEQEELSWTNLISDQEDEMGWDNPLATYYGISGIPTAILVDQSGKVVSMRARGKELDRLLKEYLGDPEPDEADASEEETKSNDEIE